MQQLYRLAATPGAGARCDETGLFVGEVALLERSQIGEGAAEWHPRPIVDLNRELSNIYGFQVELAAKLHGLATVSRALQRGDIAHAQLTALFMRFPDPPSLSKSSARVTNTPFDLAKDLLASGMLKTNWDPAQHPRWPAGTEGGLGGEFAPAGGGAPASAESRSNPHQIAVPLPGEIPEAVPRPLPGEIGAPPIAAPQAMPRNPYPTDADCAKEWEDAEKYCGSLVRRGLLGKGDYRQAGRTFRDCLMGQVSERCGGNQVLA